MTFLFNSCFISKLFSKTGPDVTFDGLTVWRPWTPWQTGCSGSSAVWSRCSGMPSPRWTPTPQTRTRAHVLRMTSFPVARGSQPYTCAWTEEAPRKKRTFITQVHTRVEIITAYNVVCVVCCIGNFPFTDRLIFWTFWKLVRPITNSSRRVRQ